MGILMGSAACGARSTLVTPDEAGGASTASISNASVTATTSTASSGSSGTGGSLPGPDVVAACVIATSCGAAIPNVYPPSDASACIDAFGRRGGWYTGDPEALTDDTLAEQLLDCAHPGVDCGAFRACFGGDWVSLSRCRSGECKGGLLSLFGGTPGSFDCAAIGATCQDLTSNAPRACCNAEPCSGSTELTCNGSVASFCGGWGQRIDVDCAPSGRVCGTDPITPCVGVGAPCSDSDPVTCSGSVATYCAGGRTATVDCAADDYRTGCASGAPAYEGPCKPAGAECDPFQAKDACDGANISVCVDGHWQTLDCTTLGFAFCAMPGTDARCVMGM
jgi:hypothetical protein